MASQTVEMNMRVPSLTIRTEGQEPRRGDNNCGRFLKQLELPSIPKPGTTLEMTIGSDIRFPVTVTRADWSEDKNMFVVSCTHSNKSIPLASYEALMADDSGWTMKPLL